MGLLDGWNPTVTPAPQAPPSAGAGLFSSFSDGVNNAISNPAFQFGIGMAGAGGEGKGLGGGLLGGTAGAQNAFKMLQARRALQMQNQRDQFAQSLNDPNNPLVKGLSPAAVAALKGVGADAAPDLLSSLLAHKGDLDNAKAVAGITANAQVQAKIAEMKYQREMNMQMLRQFMPNGGQPGAPAAPPAVGSIEGGYRFKGGNPADPNAWEVTQ